MNIPSDVNLTNKVVVVSGAAGVLCSVFAKAVAKKGAKVALLGRTLESLQKVADEIAAEGGIAKCYPCNVLDKESLLVARSAIRVDFGTCDILINGAGGNDARAIVEEEYFREEDLDRTKTFFDLDQDAMDDVYRLNYMGSLLPSQVFGIDMIRKTGCSIINIASVAAYDSLTKVPVYCGAKAAINNLTKWLSVHFAKEGIRCNAIAPGFFVAKQNYNLLFHEDGTPTKRAEKILNSTPMGRFGEPEELAGVLLFLVNEKASGYVNGAIIPVDGGFLAYSGV